MILKEIQKICNKSKVIVLINRPSEQWLGTNTVLYRVDDNLHLDKKLLFTIFDITDDVKFIYTEQNYNEDFSVPDDSVECEISNLIIKSGTNAYALVSGVTTKFIPANALKPVIKDYMIIRDDGNQLYVFEGLFLSAVIYPLKLNDEKVSELRDLINNV